MIGTFRELLHTERTCPLCGHVPDSEYALFGLNCAVCEPCQENLHLQNPFYATLYTDQGSIEIWEYIPSAPSWRGSDNHHPLFLNPQPTADNLSEDTQRAIVAFVTEQHRELLNRVKRSEVQTEILDLILRDRSLPDEMRAADASRLRSQIPTPTIITPQYVYSKDIDPLLEQKEPEQTQATLFEATN